VNHAHSGALTSLTSALQSALQNIHQFESFKKDVPQRFWHGLERTRNRDRSLCSSKLGSQVTALTNATLQAQGFLRSELWREFNADLVSLSNRLSDKAAGMEEHAQQMHERHQSETGEGVSMHLRSANIIEPS
jgi:hypothetical protein